MSFSIDQPGFPSRAGRFFPAFLILWLSLSLPALGQDNWIELQSPNFLAISNADRSVSQDFVRQLEQFQAAVGELFGFERVTGIPLLVVIFRDDHSFVPYKFLVKGRPAEIGGFYQRGRDLDVIAANVDRRATRPAAIIFHEYVHRLTSRAHSWPRWLSEGMAEFYSSFEVEERQVALGVPLEHHVELLREQSLLPLDRLLAIDHDSPEYTDADKKNIFYAESWALVHFLMMAEKGRYRSQLVKFTELIDLDYEPSDAFYRSFDMDLPELQERLQAYVGQNAYFVSKYRLSGAGADRKIEIRRLDPPSSLACLGDLLRVVRRLDDARTHYERAVSLGDRAGRGHLGLGILHWMDEDYERAERELLAALEQAPSNPQTAFYLNDIRIRRLEESAEHSPEEVATIFSSLESGIRALPDYSPNRLLFGQLALLTGEHVTRAVEFLQEATRLEPDDDQLRVALVQLLMAVPDYNQAETQLETLRRSKDSRVLDFAESVTRNIHQLQASPGDSATASAGQEAYPACNPSFVDVRGMAFMDGLLRRVNCGPEEVVFILVVDGQELTFRDPEPRFPVVFSCGLEVSQMQCGELGAPARIYYRDLSGAGRRALAVELKP